MQTNKSTNGNNINAHLNIKPDLPAPLQLVDIVFKNGTAAHMCFIRLSCWGDQGRKKL